MTSGEHLDDTALAALQGLMGKDYAALVQAFTSDSEQRIDSITAAVADHDAEALRRAAHSFKGSSSNLAAAPLAALCRRLEECGRAGELAETPRLLDELRREYTAVRQALQETLPQ